MSKLSLGVEKVAALTLVDEVDRRLAVAGSDVRQIRALEELAEAGKRYAQTHEQRVAASLAKLKIARHGGRVLIDMAATGKRQNAGRPNGSSAEPFSPRLEDMGLSKQRSSRWQAVSRLSDAEYARRERLLAEVDPDAELGANPHVAANAGENEWYTPKAYIDAARLVMGGIDLDPASTAVANKVIGAETFYTAEQDGLRYGWHGRVWMNPPYAKDLYWRFAEKLSEEVAQSNVEQACALVNNSTETVAFQRMAEVAAAICFPSGRVKFWHPERESAPLQGQAVIYFGDKVDAFRAEFLRFGFTVTL